MNGVKAIFFDVDGTLTDAATNRIPPEVPAALAALREKGVLLFVATGRSRPELAVSGVLAGLCFDAYLTMNGACCYTAAGELLRSTPLAAADLDAAIDFFTERPLPCIFLEAETRFITASNAAVAAEQAKIHDVVPPVRPAEAARGREIYQLIPFFSRAEEAQLLARMPESRVSRWSETVVDIIPKNGSKREGAAAVLAHYGIDPAACMAFGDSVNDIELLSFVGCGVAMGGSPPEVCAAAGHTAGAVTEGGLVSALRRFGALD